MKSQCLISFGSNLGDRHALIADAASAVAKLPQVHQLNASRLFQTPPIGGPTVQEPFLNAVAAFETEASARVILAALQGIETELGRHRRQRWDARPIDLDVVLHGELVGGGTGLIVPHPRYTARQFVLQPACDVAAHYRDPRFGWTLKRLTEHIGQGVPSLAMVGGDLLIREELCRRLESQYGIQTFAAKPLAEPMRVVGNAPAPKGTANDLGPMPSPEHDHAGSDEQPGAGQFGVGGAMAAGERATRQDGTRAAIHDMVGTDGGGIGCVNAAGKPWVSAFIPPLPSLDAIETASPNVPRLVARMQSTTDQTRWPAPHQMWPSGWYWPEYRLEIDDLDWAVSELASALSSMRCPVEAVTIDGDWW